jgi:cytochrome c oxidase cbb3-type subunit 3
MSERDEVREHTFDGIQEYDNDLPRWWIGLFALTVVFSVLYPFFYDFGPGEFASQSIDGEMASIKAAQASAEAAEPEVNAEALMKFVSNPAGREKGKAVYLTRCMPCHGDQGQGLVCPNLTDEFWIHGGAITDVYHTVKEGVIEKGMLAWKTQLPAEEIQAVTAYIWSLHGTSPANPKAPEGERHPR